jgi:hypothetical protein
LQVFGADFFLDHRSGGIEVGHTIRFLFRTIRMARSAFSFVLYPDPHPRNCIQHGQKMARNLEKEKNFVFLKADVFEGGMTDDVFWNLKT